MSLCRKLSLRLRLLKVCVNLYVTPSALSAAYLNCLPSIFIFPRTNRILSKDDINNIAVKSLNKSTVLSLPRTRINVTKRATRLEEARKMFGISHQMYSIP